MNVTITPATPIEHIKEEWDFVSRTTKIYPTENLQPNTTYNVSGTLMELSAWWTFTTASTITPQIEYEVIPSPYTWHITLIATVIATTFFIVIIWKKLKLF